MRFSRCVQVGALVRIAQTPVTADASVQIQDDERALRLLVRHPPRAAAASPKAAVLRVGGPTKDSGKVQAPESSTASDLLDSQKIWRSLSLRCKEHEIFQQLNSDCTAACRLQLETGQLVFLKTESRALAHWRLLLRGSLLPAVQVRRCSHGGAAATVGWVAVRRRCSAAWAC